MQRDVYQSMKVIVSVCWLAVTFSSWTQSVIQIEKRANEALSNQQYELAKVDFQTLFSREPKSPTYNYNYGICLFYTNERSAALNHFQLAATLGTGICEAQYYIGRIHHLNYDFIRAISAYNAYVTCFPEDPKNARREIERCNHGKKLLVNSTALEVLKSEQLPMNGFLSRIDFSDLGLSGGYYTDLTLQSKIDKKKGFIPHTFVKAGNKYKIYPSYVESADMTSLYLKTKKGDVWSEPIKIPLPMDEKTDVLYPFYHTESGHLYFSSNGFNAMGGFDFFKVSFDPASMTLGEVVNLGFPFSSTDDDFLFVPLDSAGNHAAFSTIRSSDIGKIEWVQAIYQKSNAGIVLVQGAFKDQVNPKNTNLQIKVKDLERGLEYGPFVSDSSGNYQVVLPGEGSYEFVASISGTQQVFIDKKVLPKQASGVVFEQNIDYTMNDSKELASFSYKLNGKANEEMLSLKSKNIASLNKMYNPKEGGTLPVVDDNGNTTLSQNLFDLGFTDTSSEIQAQALSDKLLEISNIGEDFNDKLLFLDREKTKTAANIRQLNLTADALKERIVRDTSIAVKKVYQSYLMEIYDSLVEAKNTLATNQALTQQLENDRRKWIQNGHEDKATKLSENIQLYVLNKEQDSLSAYINAHKKSLSELMAFSKVLNEDSIALEALKTQQQTLKEDKTLLLGKIEQSQKRIAELESQVSTASKKDKLTLQAKMEEEKSTLSKFQKLLTLKEDEQSATALEISSIQQRLQVSTTIGNLPTFSPTIKPDLTEVLAQQMEQKALQKQLVLTNGSNRANEAAALDELNAEMQVVRYKMERTKGNDLEALSEQYQKIEAQIENLKEQNTLSQNNQSIKNTNDQPKNETASVGENGQPKNETAAIGENGQPKNETAMVGENGQPKNETAAIGENGQPKNETAAIGENGQPKNETAAVGENGQPKNETAAIGENGQPKNETAAIGENGQPKNETAAVGENGQPKNETAAVGENGQPKNETAAIGENGQPKNETAAIGENGQPKNETASVGENGQPKNETAAVGENGQPKNETTAVGENGQPKNDNALAGDNGQPKNETAMVGENGQPKNETAVIGENGQPKNETAAIGENGQPKNETAAVGENGQPKNETAAIGENGQPKNETAMVGENGQPKNETAAVGENGQPKNETALVGENGQPKNETAMVGENGQPKNETAAVGENGQPKNETAAVGENGQPKNETAAVGENGQPKNENAVAGDNGQPKNETAMVGENGQPKNETAAVGENGQPKNESAMVRENGQPKNKIKKDQMELEAQSALAKTPQDSQDLAILARQIGQVSSMVDLRASMPLEQFSVIFNKDELEEYTLALQERQAAYNKRNEEATFNLEAIQELGNLAGSMQEERIDSVVFSGRKVSQEEAQKIAQSGGYDVYVTYRKEFVQLEEEKTQLEKTMDLLKIQYFRSIDSNERKKLEMDLLEISSKIIKVTEQKDQKMRQMMGMNDHEIYAGLILEGVLPQGAGIRQELIKDSQDLSFSINDGPKSQNNQYPVTQNLPEGLIFRVQVGAFKNKVPDYFFREFTPVSGEMLKNGLTAYLAGFFEGSESAIAARQGIRDLGYKDAFVVAYCDGKRIPFAQGVAYEKNGMCRIRSREELLTEAFSILKPLVDSDSSIADKPKEVFYTVQVASLAKEDNGKLAAVPELFYQKATNGNFKYSSGKFMNLDEAKSRRDAMKTIGFQDAFVIAYRDGIKVSFAEAEIALNYMKEPLMAAEPLNHSLQGTTLKELQPTYVQLKKSEKILSKEQLGNYNSLRFVTVESQKQLTSSPILMEDISPLELIYYADFEVQTIKDSLMTFKFSVPEASTFAPLLHDVALNNNIPFDVIKQDENRIEFLFYCQKEEELVQLNSISQKLNIQP
jgi:hypothetical protein